MKKILFLITLPILAASAFLFLRFSESAAAQTSTPSSELTVYEDVLQNGFKTNTWGENVLVTLSNPNKVSGSYSLETNLNNYGTLFLYKDQVFNVDDYSHLEFDVYSMSPTYPKFGIFLANTSWSTTGGEVMSDSYVTLGQTWKHVRIPLSDFNAGGTQIAGIRIRYQMWGISGYGNILLDNIKLSKVNGLPTPTPLPADKIIINIDPSTDNHPISPLIYGVSDSSNSKPYYKEMGVSLVRWGGNARSRFNWETNNTNSGSDWYFANANVFWRTGVNTTPGKASLDFVNSNKAIGAESLLTIPMIGWVAKDGSDTTRSTGAPSNGGSPVSPGSEVARLCNGTTYDPTVNRGTTSFQSLPKKNAPFIFPPDKNDGKVYQDEWVNYLKTTLGSAANGGVRFYSMDNEMDLWDSTHVDIHPVRPGYDETLRLFTEYAKAVKAVDPAAQVTAPVGWGWLSLWYSALDAGCGGTYAGTDRTAHGNIPYYQWLLQKIKEHDAQAGFRTLDVLDTHIYPQGGLYWPGNVDTASQALRLRSTRSLWDPKYADESWMKDTDGGPYLQLIPRLKGWINQYYPGTKLGITEWNWGAENHINGGIAIAEVLGVFGRENLDMATYWTAPPDKSPGYFAWRMFRNYDGNYSTFGDVSVKATVSDDYKVSAYASKDSKTGELKVMVINKMPLTPATVNLNSGFSDSTPVKVYQYSKNDLSQIKQSNVSALNGAVSDYTVPPYSITLFVSGQGTVNPTPCTLSSASWGSLTAVKGLPVYLNVTGNGGCSGKQVTYEIRRNGLPLVGDIAADNQPALSVFSGNTSSTTWTAEYNPQWPATDPEYYFKATLQGGNTLESDPKLIKITDSGSGGPSPTPTPTPTPTPPTTPGSAIFVDSITEGWVTGGWNQAYNLTATDYKYSGNYSISFANTAAWGYLDIFSKAGLDTTPYTNLRFYIHGGGTGNQNYVVKLKESGGLTRGGNIPSFIKEGSISASEWRLVDVPLSSIGMQGKTITNFYIQDALGSVQPKVYLDNIEFVTEIPSPTPTTQPTPTLTPTPTPTLTPSPTPTSAPQYSADINKDGRVDSLDSLELFNNWGSSAAGNIADINKDGVVNGADYFVLSNQWSLPSTPTPTPTTPAAVGLVVYDDAFQNKFKASADSSTLITASRSDINASGSYSMELNLFAFRTPWFYTSAGKLNSNDYSYLEFDAYFLNGTRGPVPHLYVSLSRNPWDAPWKIVTAAGSGSSVPIVANSSWTHIKIPFSSFGIPANTEFKGLTINDREPWYGNDPNADLWGHVLIDNIKFTK